MIRHGLRSDGVGLLVLITLHAATALGLLIGLNHGGWEACDVAFAGGWAACDQIRHIRLIDYFIQHPFVLFQYPDPDLVANLPGFHLLVAWVARLFGLRQLDPDTWLRLISFAFGAGTLAILWCTFRSLSKSGWFALLLCLPVLWSNYFYLSSVFLVTENAAYLGFAFLLVAYREFPRRGLAIGLAGFGMVYARQIFLPVVGAHLFAFSKSWLTRPVDRGRILAVLLGILPPAAVVITYLLAWGGLVPPEVSRLHAARSIVELGPVAQAVGLLGVLGIPYAFLVHPALRGLHRRRLAATVVAGCVVALAFWLLAPTTRDLDAGRAGSFLWLLARVSPTIDDHALLALPVLGLGFTAGALMIELARIKGYVPIELIMLALYVAGLSMQLLSYQRYTEVVTLITLSATTARLGPPSGVGAMIFTALWVVKTAVTLFMPLAG